MSSRRTFKTAADHATFTIDDLSFGSPTSRRSKICARIETDFEPWSNIAPTQRVLAAVNNDARSIAKLW